MSPSPTTASPPHQPLSRRSRVLSLLGQLALWGLLAGFYTAWFSRANFSFRAPIWPLVVLRLSYAVLLFNCLVYVLIPRWLLRGRYGLALLGGVGLAVLFRIWEYAGTGLMTRYLPANSDLLRQMQSYNSPADLRQSFTTVAGLLDLAYGPLTAAMFPILVSFLAYAWLVDRRRLALEATHFQLELSYLKAQLNPQLLFNTLGHLQDLTHARDPRAGDVVLHLSDLLRYTLYETDHDYVPLARELDFLADYLALEQLRYPAAQLTHAVSGLATTQQLAPLLLTPFYEQLFAGLAPDTAAPRLSSALQVEEEALTLTLHRDLDLDPASTPPPYRAAAAIETAARRLRLQYPGRHELRVQESGATLRVYLRLDLRRA